MISGDRYTWPSRSPHPRGAYSHNASALICLLLKDGPNQPRWQNGKAETSPCWAAGRGSVVPRLRRPSCPAGARAGGRAAMEYDGVIVGAGHNGLICASYLAKAGLSIAIVERNEVTGGGCNTSEFVAPGFKHDSLCLPFHRRRTCPVRSRAAQVRTRLHLPGSAARSNVTRRQVADDSQ